MSYIYSRALVEASSAANYSDTKLCALLNGNHTHKPCLWHDKMMEPSRLSRFGMTCKPLTEDLGAALLTLWREAFHAKTYQSPEKAQELTESEAECGNTWRGWLAKYDRATSLWRTAQCSFLEDLTECLEILPRSGMTRDGLLWELPTLERRTNVTDFGSWPTPTVSGNYNKKGLSPTSGDGLATAVMKSMWPTPTVQGLNGGSNSRSAAMKRGMWPTTTAHNAKETNAPSEAARNTPTLAAQAGGALNPDWVEWLMGWPIGHTDLKQLETAKCRNAQQQLGDI